MEKKFGGAVFSCVLLVALWLLSRWPALMSVEFWAQWDIFQARKLLDYGFWERQGALTPPLLAAGKMPFPEDLNYTNHPYFGVWCYTFLYWLGGAGLCLGVLVGLRAGALVLSFLFLRRFFGATPALASVFLTQFSVAALDNDVASNIICVTASLWPYLAWLALRVREGRNSPVSLGAAIFMVSQISWFILCTVPYFLSFLWRKGDQSRMNRAGVAAVLGGATLGAIVFVLQFIYFVPSASEAFAYLQAQAGATPGAPSRWKLTAYVAARHAFFLGGGLLLAAAIGAFSGGSENQRLLKRSVLVFLGAFLTFELIIVRFCFVETSPYYYWLFPLSILAAMGIAGARSRWILVSCVVLTLPTVVLGYLRHSVPQQSRSARILAELIQANTRAGHIVLTNIVPGTPPLEAWDTAAPVLIPALADRIILFGQVDPVAIANGLRVGRNPGGYVFLRDVDAPLDVDLAQSLRAHEQEKVGAKVEFVPQKRPLAANFWDYVWRWTGRYPNRRSVGTSETAELEFIHLPKTWLQTLRGEIKAGP